MDFANGTGGGRGTGGVGSRALGAAPPAGVIAEVLDILALVTITIGFSKRIVTGISPIIPGAAQHR